MFSNSHFRHQRSGLPSVFGGFANITALIGAIYAAPLAWPLVEAKIWNSLIGLYSHDWAALLYWGVKLDMYPLSFFALRAGFMAAFNAAFLFALRRLM